MKQPTNFFYQLMSSILKEIKKLLKQIQVNGQLQIKIAPKEEQKKLPTKRRSKRVIAETAN